MPTYPEVIAIGGAVKDWNYLISTYGHMEILKPLVYPQFRLIRIEEMEGPSITQIMVLDANGRPAISQPVALSWPRPEDPSSDLPKIDPAGTKSLWANRAVIQRVDASGTTAFGLGHDSYIRDFEVGGPYTVFIVSPSTYSEGLAHFGWLGGTNHRGPTRLTFQEFKSASGPNPPPVDPGGGGSDAAAIAALDAKVVALAKHLGLEL